MTDDELVNMFINGNKSAFNELYEKYINQAVRTAFLITKDRALSDDVAQETFVKCYLGLKKLKDPKLFRSWFFKILVRTAWELGKKKANDVPIEEIFDKAEAAFEKDEETSDFRLLYEAVNSLSKKQRTAVVLFYFNDMPVNEISKITGCLTSTVKSQLFLARKRMRKYIENAERKGGLIANEA
ncbi:sigma-70 family RNA polymerase sigma factor [Lachnospiraceae bacterium NSJ-143]|nr:sigma-70 family RNA polymerase sigma factor [Lachnospiraceae bacterium NSJ-143]